MTHTGRIFLTSFLLFLYIGADAQTPYRQPYRPQLHFSPEANWMNDPNGLVYYQGTYHLFFQYYPHDIVWGPMHWGHATSKDLIHWQQQAIALFPDSLGYIFSGSAVVDSENTTGFGHDGKIPLVAIFTHHNPAGEKAGMTTFQNQSLAYSLDGGITWEKYSGNPVLHNPGIVDFRDPSVSWYAPGKKWVMSLATRDRITFYSSPDLKNWKKESEFGAQSGAHGGVWECPNLFPLSLDGKQYWVLLVSTNPGGPNGGSGTQYFVGQFDGSVFTPEEQTPTTKWIDFGPDDYAGITWNNTGNKRVFIGWMSNWIYANQVPTATWRNAMTIPRRLALRRIDNRIHLVSRPLLEMEELRQPVAGPQRLEVRGALDLSGHYHLDTAGHPYRLTLQTPADNSFSVVLSNHLGQRVTLGFDQSKNQYYIDRKTSGVTDFNREFSKVAIAPRISTDKMIHLSLFVDASSLELFADDGLTVMTAVFFPHHPLDGLSLVSERNALFTELSYSTFRSIWQ